MKKEKSFINITGKKSICIILMFVYLVMFTLSGYADNPIFTNVYTADPSAYIGADGKMYVVCTHDQAGATGYDQLWNYYVFSSSDMYNWQNEGIVFDARTDSSWASLAYAPSMAYRNGTYYLYYPDGANAIGVATSSSPSGPFHDVLGRAMLDRSVPNGNVEWCFDPCIFVDDDGQAYMYYGGGGPGNARVIRVNSDMTSVSGSAVTIDAPRFFEAAYMHKRNGIYYFSYSTDFSAGAATIDYMTSSDPMTGFQHRGTILDNPWSNLGNNNHASIIEYQGQWYIFYHNRALSDAVYERSVCVDYLYYNSDGTIQRVNDTQQGVDPITSTVEPTPTGTPGPTPVPGTISIACGSSSDVGIFLADQYYSGGSTYNNTNTIDVSQIIDNPPPAELFNNERYGEMSYTIPNFTSGNSYIVTLYFAETYLTSSGERLFDVSINGATVLSGFDIYASAGGQNIAIARSFTVAADSSGQIAIQFTAGTENPKINGISIQPGEGPTVEPTPDPTDTPTPTPTPVVGDCNVSFDPANSTQGLNSTFPINIVVDSGSQELAAYGFTVSYNANVLSVADVEAGADGFLAAANTDNPGEIVASGFDTSGTGPGSNLQVLVITFNANAKGTSTLGLYVDQLVDGGPTTIGTACGNDGSVEVTDVMLGDVNGDGAIDIVDALLTAQFYVGLDPANFIPENADTNCDGNIDIVDALLIAQYYVGLILQFC
jgi:hypothetical protein